MSTGPGLLTPVLIFSPPPADISAAPGGGTAAFCRTSCLPSCFLAALPGVRVSDFSPVHHTLQAACQNLPIFCAVYKRLTRVRIWLSIEEAPHVKPVDLRSDTVTKPTLAMREVMARAEVGDDVYGEDPTVLALEERAASELGCEAALFVPSGTMANQLAIHVHCRPGEEVLVGAGAHSLIYETGAGPALSGVQITPLGRSVYSAEEARSAYHDDMNVHNSPTRLLMVENTHNRAGGVVFPLEELRRIREFTRSKGLALHMDGARLFNAVVATGIPASVWAAEVDSVSFCLSKGLGCPVGSLLLGSRDFIRHARRARKRFGGGLRQAGFLAAAGLYALDHHVQRLADDHTRALKLAQGWGSLPGLMPDPLPPTNILYLQITTPGLDAPTLVARLKSRGILTNVVTPHQLRAVTHLDVDDAGIHHAIDAMSQCLATP